MNAKSVRPFLMIAAALALFAGLLAPTFTAFAADPITAHVIVDRLNFREGPSLSYDVIKILPRGTAVTVIENSSDGFWAKVTLSDGSQGWVYRSYIQLDAAISTSGIVLVEELNLRIGPGFSYRSVLVLDKGDNLTIVGRSLYSDWLQVETTGGDEGWVFAPYVETATSISSLPVTEAYGGPDGSGTSSTPLSLVVTIRNNQGHITLRSFPANT